jgi:hypothetical protein
MTPVAGRGRSIRAVLCSVVAANRRRSVFAFGARCVGSLKMPDEKLSGVGETAIGAAMMRVDESARSDRLFEDSYAPSFLRSQTPSLKDQTLEARRLLSSRMPSGRTWRFGLVSTTITSALRAPKDVARSWSSPPGWTRAHFVSTGPKACDCLSSTFPRSCPSRTRC